jgi:putative toxin-antitoxin system antitoxin component (TIGR02293 family)
MAAVRTSSVRKKAAPVPKGRRIVREILRGASKTDTQIIDAVRWGLPASALEDLLRAGLELVEIARVVGVSERTLQRKRERGPSGSLDVAESDRTIRLARILAQADRCIGNHEKALHWLRTPNLALGDRVPLDLLATEPGAEMVRQSLVTIAYGGVA